MFFCGIDIAKYKHEASVIDTDGKALIDSISFANDKQGCEKDEAILKMLNDYEELLSRIKEIN